MFEMPIPRLIYCQHCGANITGDSSGTCSCGKRTSSYIGPSSDVDDYSNFDFRTEDQRKEDSNPKW